MGSFLSEITKHRRDYHEDIDRIQYLENEEEFEKILDMVSIYIGRIVIEFNSLEESIEFCTKELVSSSETGDDQVYVFLAEMSFSSKVTALMNLYGQIIDFSKPNDLDEVLADLDLKLRESARRRNQYVHGGWSGISNKNYVRVKTKAKKSGFFHIYRQFDETEIIADLEFIQDAHEMLEKFDSEINALLYG